MKKIFTLFLLFAVAFSGVAQEEYSDLLNLLVDEDYEKLVTAISNISGS